MGGPSGRWTQFGVVGAGNGRQLPSAGTSLKAKTQGGRDSFGVDGLTASIQHLKHGHSGARGTPRAPRLKAHVTWDYTNIGGNFSESS